jgi:hypothetical protein
MEISEAVQQFRQAALRKGDCAVPASLDHALHSRMAEAWRELENHGEQGRRAFKALLADESPYVRSWVASQLLALGDESGIAVLRSDVAAGGVRGLDAEMVLEEWLAGRLSPPFGAVDV